MTKKQKLPQLKTKPPGRNIYQEFLHTLKNKGFLGDIADGYSQRLMAATDNSIYQVLPEGVLYPKCQDDISLVLGLCGEKKYRDITIAARGGGTGTNGQSLTEGLVLDLSRYMHKILDLDLENMEVKVQPGVVLDQLNQYLSGHGVFFAPNLSPSSRATLGGMCSTDACGKGSRVYGRTSDHIKALEVVFLGGQKADVAKIRGEDLEKAKLGEDKLSYIYKVVDGIIESNKEEIKKLYPELARFITGYNLKKTKNQDGDMDLTYLISGSEGSLCVVSQLTLKLTKIPRFSELILVKYRSFDDALRGASDLVSFDPHAIETIDDKIINLAQKDIIWHEIAPMLGEDQDNIAAVNLIEFSGMDALDIEKKTKPLKDFLADKGYDPFCTTKKDEIKALWNLRKKGVGLLGNLPGQRRPIPFVEDTAVPPSMLADYIKEFKEVLDSHGLSYGMFGHVDVGCLHVRPILNLRDPKDEALVRVISDKIKNLVVKYHGVMWGEHGRGYRSEYTKDFFGENLFQSLREIKGAFDPYNQLNPGKMVTPKGATSEVLPLDGVTLRGQKDRVLDSAVLDSYKSAINCNGNGACFHFDPDYVMCPSHKVTRDRIHSPKGRASLMREWLAQVTIAGYNPLQLKKGVGWHRRRGAYDFSHEIYDGMKGCLACKACSSQCPVKVDIPEHKSRFLESYHSRYQRPLFDYAVLLAEHAHSRLKGPLLKIHNFFMARGFVKAVLKKTLGLIDAPLLSEPRLEDRLKKAGYEMVYRGSSKPLAKENKVILIQDAVTALYEAKLVEAVLGFLRKIGFEPIVAEFLPNGKGQHVKGFRDSFKKTAALQLSFLKELEKTGIPLIGIDPAITLTYREEYKELLSDSAEVLMVHEFLFDNLDKIKVEKPKVAKKFSLFAHCGEQTSGAAKLSNWQAIFEHFGHELEVVAVGCCGMAGAYGHEACHKETSKGIFEMSWQRHLALVKEKKRVPLATGASCRLQVERFYGAALLHPFEGLLEVLLGANK